MSEPISTKENLLLIQSMLNTIVFFTKGPPTENRTGSNVIECELSQEILLIKVKDDQIYRNYFLLCIVF